MQCCSSDPTPDVFHEEAGVPKVVKRQTYAVELECSDPDTRHWRHIWCYKKNGGKLVSKPKFLPEDVPATIPALVANAVKKNPNGQCMGTRTILRQLHDDGTRAVTPGRTGPSIIWYKGDYSWNTYAEFGKSVEAIAQGLLGLDQIMALHSSGKCNAAILAETSAEWMMSAQAAFKVGIPLSTVYTTLGPEAMLHGLNETECAVLFLDWIYFKALDETVTSKCASLKHIVLIGKCWVPEEVVGGEKVPFPSIAEVSSLAKKSKAKVTTLDALIEASKKNSTVVCKTVKEDDLAFVMYTSGSTGVPKGVMISHLNVVSCLAGVWAQDVAVTKPEDTMVAYLPLAHIFELITETGVLAVGARLGYGSPKTLSAASVYMPRDNPSASDLMTLKPTLMCAVPAVLDLIKTGLQRITQNMPGFKGTLVRTAIEQAQGNDVEDPVVGMLCSMGLGTPTINKVRSQLGLENLRMIGSGGAPLAPQTQSFITAVLAPVAQGYGSTETCGATTIQEVFSTDGRPVDSSCGMVGPITPSGELKLRSVPDMGYLVTDEPPRGEILLGGYAVSQEGYYKNSEKTKEEFPIHADGRRWFHTGDIGVLEASGVIRIIDRKKDLIKLSGGEFVSLGKVENALKQVPGIAACVVFAASDKDHCVAIVSQPEKGWASVGGRPDEVMLLKRIGESLLNQKLVRFEIPTAVKVDEMIWTPESGLITASLKVQRMPLRKHYNSPGGLLDEMKYRFPEK